MQLRRATMLVLIAAMTVAACGGGSSKAHASNSGSSNRTTPTSAGGTSEPGDLTVLRSITLDKSDIANDIDVEGTDKSFIPADGNNWGANWYTGIGDGTNYTLTLYSNPEGMTAGLSRNFTASSSVALQDFRSHVAAFPDEGAATTFYNKFADQVDSICKEQSGDSGAVSDAKNSDWCVYRPNEREERAFGIVRVGRFLGVITLLGDPNSSHKDLVNSTLGQVAKNMTKSS